MLLIRALGAIICAGMATWPAQRALAGPPFVTDDPEPVPYQHFEFYTFSLGTAIRGDTFSEAPAWEYNYGIIPDGQFHIIAPLSFNCRPAPTGMAIRNLASNTV